MKGTQHGSVFVTIIFRILNKRPLVVYLELFHFTNEIRGLNIYKDINLRSGSRDGR